jgi:hypothetical protein
MPQFETPPHRPDRSTFWRESIYYARVDELPAKPDSATTMAAAASTQLTGSPAGGGPPLGTSHIRVHAASQEEWDGGYATYYFSDTLPAGTRAADWYTTWDESLAYFGGDINFVQGRDHVYFPDLRQEGAVKQIDPFLGTLFGNYLQYVPVNFGDRHAVCWCEEDRELFECIGYSGLGPQSQRGATYSLDSYDLPVGANGTTPVSTIVIGIPAAPFMFTYQDLLDCGSTGDLGHMLGFSLTNYKTGSQWPARNGDGLLASGPVGGEVIRLPADYDLAALPNDQSRAIARTLMKYGAMLYDTGGIPSFLSPNDPQWPLSFTNSVGDIFQLTDFETVDISSISGAPNSIQIVGATPPPVPPTAAASWTADDSLTVAVSASASTAGDAAITSYSWDWGDGSADSTGVTSSHTYAAAGTYTVTLTVTDADDLTDAVVIAVETPAFVIPVIPDCPEYPEGVGEPVAVTTYEPGVVGAALGDVSTLFTTGWVENSGLDDSVVPGRLCAVPITLPTDAAEVVVSGSARFTLTDISGSFGSSNSVSVALFRGPIGTPTPEALAFDFYPASSFVEGVPKILSFTVPVTGSFDDLNVAFTVPSNEDGAQGAWLVDDAVVTVNVCVEAPDPCIGLVQVEATLADSSRSFTITEGEIVVPIVSQGLMGAGSIYNPAGSGLLLDGALYGSVPVLPGDSVINFVVSFGYVAVGEAVHFAVTTTPPAAAVDCPDGPTTGSAAAYLIGMNGSDGTLLGMSNPPVVVGAARPLAFDETILGTYDEVIVMVAAPGACTTGPS